MRQRFILDSIPIPFRKAMLYLPYPVNRGYRSEVSDERRFQPPHGRAFWS